MNVPECPQRCPCVSSQHAVATRYRKGACENCGALTHKKKDCMEVNCTSGPVLMALNAMGILIFVKNSWL